MPEVLRREACSPPKKELKSPAGFFRGMQKYVKTLVFLSVPFLAACSAHLDNRPGGTAHRSGSEHHQGTARAVVTPFKIIKGTRTAGSITEEFKEGWHYKEYLRAINQDDRYSEFVLVPFTRKLQKSKYAQMVRDAQIGHFILGSVDDVLIAVATDGVPWGYKILVSISKYGLDKLNKNPTIDDWVFHDGKIYIQADDPLEYVKELIKDGVVPPGGILSVPVKITRQQREIRRGLKEVANIGY